MSNQQPPGPWTANRQRQSQSASRTPQNRSATQSPSNTAAQSPRLDGARNSQNVSNVWAQRSNNVGGTNGTDAAGQTEAQSLNSFDSGAVNAFLSRDAASVTPYKPTEAPGATRSIGAWGSRPNMMANNQPFFSQLAKQIATLEGGG